MKKPLSTCIAIIGLCVLLSGLSFADGGGAKSVDENVYGIGVNRDCENNLLKCSKDSKEEMYIEGYFTAHQETNSYISHVSLENAVDTPFSPNSSNKKLYYISIPFKGTYQHICAYTDQELMDRFEAFACKKRIDKDYVGIGSHFQARVVKITKTSEFNCGGSIDDEDKPMISGIVTIKICPKP